MQASLPIKNKLFSNENEYKGLLKKGMNFSAHFIIARRSLFELLYDKVDDWVNPANT